MYKKKNNHNPTDNQTPTGGLGIIIGFTVLLCHLFKLKSFETPYMVPLYPFRRNNFKDSFIRSPFSEINKKARFFESLSTYGLAQILDTNCKDPQIGILRIVISNGSPSKIL
jgi:hypothetical protein